MEFKDYLFRNFSFYRRTMVNQVVRYKDLTVTRLLVELDNGDVYVWDDEFNAIYKMPRDSDHMTENESRYVFGLILADIMRWKDVSQVALSNRTGISQQAISSYIRGTRTPTFYIVDKIARALDCSMDDFRYFGFN